MHNAERFSGHDGTALYERSWSPAQAPRAAIALVHGLIEHSGRHARTAAEIAREGYAVHAMDLRGHGLSAGPRGDVGTFDDYLLDLDVFMARVRDKAGALPLILMGNSMGGLIVTTWTISRRPPIAGLILTGPLLAMAEGLYPRLRYLSRAMSMLGPSMRVPAIPLQWLSRAAEVVANFRSDPLVCDSFTVRVAAELPSAMNNLRRRAAELTAPLLILHGSEDRVCGPAGSRELYRLAGSADKTLHVYEGLFHEVLDEPERQRVLADLLDWLGRHVEAEVSGQTSEVRSDL